MIEHFNTAEGWPQTEAETIALDVEGLHSFSKQCAVEPAEPSNCLACLAYMELGRRDRIFPQRGRAADRAQLKSDRMLEALEKLEALKRDLERVWADPDGRLFMVIIDLERALGQELLLERRNPPHEVVQPSIEARRVWRVWAERDMTEGRLGLGPTNDVFSTEQEAWDSINTLGGISGTRPEIAYPGTGAKTWQEFKQLNKGRPGHYDVRAELVEPLIIKGYNDDGLECNLLGDHR